MTVKEQNKLEGMTFIEQLDAIVSKKMVPIYWMIGGTLFIVLTIFVSVSMPLTQSLISAIKEMEGKASKEDLKSTNDKIEGMLKDRERDYLKKQDYYLIEDDEHRVLKEVIRNPAQMDYLMTVINDNIKEQLGFKWSTRGGTK